MAGWMWCEAEGDLTMEAPASSWANTLGGWWVVQKAVVLMGRRDKCYQITNWQDEALVHFSSSSLP